MPLLTIISLCGVNRMLGGLGRWHVLFLCCVISFAVDFVYDEPSALVQRLTGTSGYCLNGTDTGCLRLDMTQYNAFFSGASWASAVAAIIAGFAVDQYGPQTPLWLSMGFLFAGVLVFAAGSYATSTQTAFAVMLTGRILYGIGTGAVVTVAHQIKSAWFQYKELALAFALHILSGRIGSALNYLLIGGVVSSIGLSNALWIGFGITLLACIAIIDLIRMEERIHDSGMPKTLRDMGMVFTRLDAMFWSFAVFAFLIYGIVSTWTANGVALMADVYGLPESRASYIVGIVYDVCLITPFIAYMLDHYGRRDWWMTGAGILLLIGLVVGFSVSVPGGVISLFIGLSYAIYPTTLYSSLPLLVPSDTVGVANGVIKFFQYTGTGILTIIAGVILDKYPMSDLKRWWDFNIFLVIMVVLVVIVGVVINFMNRSVRYGHRLTPSQAERAQTSNVEEVTPIADEYVAYERKSSGAIRATGSPALSHTSITRLTTTR